MSWRGGRVSIAVLLALAAPLGCSGSERPAPPVERTVVDGVEVVTSHRPAWAPDEGWRLAPEPEVAIGDDEEDPRYLFGDVIGAVRLSDGTIVVGDAQTEELRYFGSAGDNVRVVGSGGEGPGQFNRLAEVHRCGRGTVYARDLGRDELNVFDASGRFVERHPFEENAGVSVYVGLSCNEEGQLLAMDWGDEFGGESRQGHYRTTVHIWLLDPQGHVLHDFGPFPGVDRLGLSLGSIPHPLGKTPAKALGEGHAYIGTADEFEIEVRSLEGELVRGVRRSVEPGAITGDHIERHLEFAARDDSRDAEELSRYGFDAENSPATFPAYSRFLLDTSGHLWVENYRMPWEEAELRRWSVFDPEGVWLGDVEVPPTFEITDIGDDHVLGVFRDELEQESVRLYPLSRAADPSRSGPPLAGAIETERVLRHRAPQ